MRFDTRKDKYQQSVEDALATIIEKGNKTQKFIASEIIASDMLLRVAPVSEVNASGITGVADSKKTNRKIDSGAIELREAFGEVFITIAEETIDTGGQRGCEGTLVHEGRHAYDFAKAISTFSRAAELNGKIYNPTLYELEWEAHKTSGDYMIRIGLTEYIDEGIQLMILRHENEVCEVYKDGIKLRLQNNYGLNEISSKGAAASEMLGIRPRKRGFSFKRFFGFGN